MISPEPQRAPPTVTVSTEALTVIHVTSALAFGGAERMLVDLCNGLFLLGRQVEVCVTRTDTRLASALRPEIRMLVLGRRRTWDLGALFTFARHCLAQSAVVLHAHGRSSF